MSAAAGRHAVGSAAALTADEVSGRREQLVCEFVHLQTRRAVIQQVVVALQRAQVDQQARTRRRVVGLRVRVQEDHDGFVPDHRPARGPRLPRHHRPSQSAL